MKTAATTIDIDQEFRKRLLQTTSIECFRGPKETPYRVLTDIQEIIKTLLEPCLTIINPDRLHPQKHTHTCVFYDKKRQEILEIRFASAEVGHLWLEGKMIKIQSKALKKLA